jgi:hypothetical protein
VLAAAREEPEGVDLDPFHALQRFIASGHARVSLPFGERLAKETDVHAVRMRRDFPAVLALTRAHALLHQGSREQDGKGSIVAQRDDYAAVYGLIGNMLAEGAERSVPPEVRRTVRAVADIHYRPGGPGGQPVTMGEIAKKLGRSRSTASRNANWAAKLGYLDDVGDRRRRRYVPGDPMPEDRGVLPPPKILD